MSQKKNIKILKGFLKEDSWSYTFDEKDAVFKTGGRTQTEIGTLEFLLQVTDDYVACLCIMPIRAAEKEYQRYYELIGRINHKLLHGGFRLDPTDGELRFQYVMTSEELQDDPTEKARKVLYLPAQMMNIYGGAFLRMKFSDKSPEELVALAEANRKKEEADDARKAADEDQEASDDEFEAVPFEGNPFEEEDDAKAKGGVPQTVRDYTLEGLNIHGDLTLDRVLQAVRNYRALVASGNDALPDHPHMNILLWGPPGTGKSEYVNYLGQQLGCKVVIKMASDILSRWVGKSEKAIRAAFREAEEEHAILFLDELDGLMVERKQADANWQVTQVNEILHCMEHFNGIMIGATNLRDNLDAAVLRRFTYKLEFDYLEPTGKRIFFERVFETPLTESEVRRLEAIPNLTPGDFRTVSQQLYYLGESDNSTRLTSLEEESSYKKIQRKACIGFAASR